MSNPRNDNDLDELIETCLYSGAELPASPIFYDRKCQLDVSVVHLQLENQLRIGGFRSNARAAKWTTALENFCDYTRDTFYSGYLAPEFFLKGVQSNGASDEASDGVNGAASSPLFTVNAVPLALLTSPSPDNFTINILLEENQTQLFIEWDGNSLIFANGLSLHDIISDLQANEVTLVLLSDSGIFLTGAVTTVDSQLSGVLLTVNATPTATAEIPSQVNLLFFKNIQQFGTTFSTLSALEKTYWVPVNPSSMSPHFLIKNQIELTGFLGVSATSQTPEQDPIFQTLAKLCPQHLPSKFYSAHSRWLSSIGIQTATPRAFFPGNQKEEQRTTFADFQIPATSIPFSALPNLLVLQKLIEAPPPAENPQRLVPIIPRSRYISETNSFTIDSTNTQIPNFPLLPRVDGENFSHVVPLTQQGENLTIETVDSSVGKYSYVSVGLIGGITLLTLLIIFGVAAIGISRRGDLPKKIS